MKRLTDEELQRLEWAAVNAELPLHWSDVLDALAEIRESRAIRATVIAALDLLWEAVNAGDVTFEHYPWTDDNGDEHECPEDDTCSCQCSVVSEALGKAHTAAKYGIDRAARPAAALTAEEVEALRFLRGLDALDTYGYEPADAARAIRARDLIDKLLAQGGGK